MSKAIYILRRQLLHESGYVMNLSEKYAIVQKHIGGTSLHVIWTVWQDITMVRVMLGFD